MNKKGLNIIIIISSIFSLFLTFALVCFSIYFGKQVKIISSENFKKVWRVNTFKEYYYYFAFSVIGTIAAVGITALLIYLLYRINKTELLVAAETTKERVKEYRAERKAAKKEKKKAALQAKLNKLEK